MNINELPEKILVRILSFLPQSDRLESALTCRKWAQTVARRPPLLRDIWLVIELGRKEAISINSHRHHENLRLRGVHPLLFTAAFWTKVGPGLRKLELRIPCWPDEFFSILQACSNLESLKISRTIKLSALPPAINLESIQKSTFNLRHLHLNSRTDTATLERLLILMPNVSTIASESILELESGSLSRLPNMLGASRKITMLRLDWDLKKDECEQLLRISSASLRTLTFDGYNHVPRVLDALSDCSMLRDLRFQLRNDDIRLLQNILRNIPELESLSIWNYREDRFDRQEDLMAIFGLRKLRKLNLGFASDSLGSDICAPELTASLVQHLSRMISLESLTVGIGIVDNTRFRILAGMPNLRELVIYEIQWDAECLRIVLSDLGKLKTFQITGASSECTSLLRDQHAELERNISTSQGSVRSDRQGEQRFSSLEVLNISGVPLTDACLGRISSHHNRLKIVELQTCHGITNAGLVTLCQREPLLEELTVHSKNLNGKILEDLGMLCRRLRRLFVDTEGRLKIPARERFESRRPGINCCFEYYNKPQLYGFKYSSSEEST